jgi:hypothetical protein
VSVHVFNGPDGVDVTDAVGPEEYEPMRARRRATRASCVNAGPGTSAYNRTGIRVDGATIAHLYPGRIPASVSNAAGILQSAINAWRAVEPSAPSITVVADGTTRRPTANHRYDFMFKRLGGRTLAVTYTWRWSSGEHESDVVFNRDVRWFEAPGEGDGCFEGTNRYDLLNTATHELGHVYGLGHVGSSTFNTMGTTAATGETYKRSLASGDVAGIQAIY